MNMKKLMFLAALLLPIASQAQSFAINWHKVAAGGGASAGTNGSAVYGLQGTIGQQDASSAMTGSSYSLTGGFWSLVALVQSAGAPALSIARSNNSVIVSWPYPSTGFFLQTNNILDKTAWANFTGAIATNIAGSNSVTITPPIGNLYFRLGP